MIISIVLGVIAFIIIFVFNVINDLWPINWRNDIGDLIGGFILSLLMGVVIFFFSIVACSSVSEIHLADEEYFEYQLEETIDIYSLRTSDELNGMFVLGTGSISTKAKYYMVVKTNLGYQIKDIDVSKAYILYTKYQPHIEVYTHSGYKTAKAKWFTTGATTYYKIYIPEGSIIEHYEIK